MKIGLAQMSYNWSNPLSKNLRKALAFLEKASRSGAEIVCFPRHFLGKDAILGHPRKGEKTHRALRSIAERASESDIAVVCGAIRDVGEGQRKRLVTCPVISSKGELVKKIDTISLYSRERDWMQSGRNIDTTEIGGFNVGVLADLDIFLSPILQSLHKKDVDIIFYQLAASTKSLLETEQAAVVVRCQELMVPIVAVGQLGKFRKRRFLGGSMVCVPRTTRFTSSQSPGGVKTIKKLGTKERFDTVNLDLQEIAQNRKKFSFYKSWNLRRTKLSSS